MRSFLVLVLLFCLTNGIAQTQKLKSGPWAGNVELRSAIIWMEVAAGARRVKVTCYKLPGRTLAGNFVYEGTLGKEFNPVKVNITGLDVNTRYSYEVEIDGTKENLPFATNFTTKELWQ